MKTDMDQCTEVLQNAVRECESQWIIGGIIKTLLEKGFVDWIVTTGANVYHEDPFAWGLPVKQGHFEVDDNILYEKEIVRIRDVYVKFYETVESNGIPNNVAIGSESSAGDIIFGELVRYKSE